MNHRIFLVRHGENLTNLTKQFSHHRVDYLLTERGILQAQLTAELFLDRKITTIYTSPLKRAVETPAIIAHRLSIPYQVLENFCEINVGKFVLLPVSVQNLEAHDQKISTWYTGQAGARFS
jgi:broad specificity phosphatase PhoE